MTVASVLPASFPKVELHVHLEGTLTPALVDELSRRNGRAAEVPLMQWTDARQWLAVMRATGDACLRTPADYAVVAKNYLARAAAEGVIHAEPSIALVRATRLGIDAAALLDAVTAAAAEVRIGCRFLVAIDSASPADEAMRHVEVAIAFRDRGVAGIDLQGVPAPLAPFAGAFAFARDHGLGTRAHVGEFQGPKSVRAAIDILGIDRVAHGIRAAEDESLMALLAKRGIALDICPTSNVALGAVPSFERHPLRRLFDAGVPVTLGSDDPFYFHTSAAGEYAVATERLGFSIDELLQITRTAAAHSFVPPAVRAGLKAEIEACFCVRER